jgi:hypothetical protein
MIQREPVVGLTFRQLQYTGFDTLPGLSQVRQVHGCVWSITCSGESQSRSADPVARMRIEQVDRSFSERKICG